MPVLKKTTMIIAFFTISAICWIGCSDDTIVKYVDRPAQADNAEPIETYFPLNEGYTTIYNVTYQSGGSEQVTFKAGPLTSFQGIEAVEWIGNSQSTLDTGYFYASGNALYFYSSKNAEPEKILQLPFSNGSTWSTNDINSNDFTDIITGTIVDTDDPNSYAKDFPTITAANFTVESTERLVMNTGETYSRTIKLSTANGTRTNYYWYASGIGLVRYVIGASTSSYPNGDIVGELVNYGY